MLEHKRLAEAVCVWVAPFIKVERGAYTDDETARYQFLI